MEKDVIIKKQQKKILEYIKENGKITSRQTEELLEVKQRRARIVLVEMVNNGLLEKQGAYKTPVYVININNLFVFCVYNVIVKYM